MPRETVGSRCDDANTQSEVGPGGTPGSSLPKATPTCIARWRNSVGTVKIGDLDEAALPKNGIAEPVRASQLRREGQLVTCRVEELRPHASYKRHRFTVSPSRLSVLARRGDLAFNEPLMVASDRTIIDGYCRWELARRQGRATVACIEYDLTEEEALHWLLYRHQRVQGLNAFCRILLALDLEPWLREQARLNQSDGGRTKGSSILTEAERVDVRSEIAASAGVSVGNVTKVKQISEAWSRPRCP